ncbi:unnamed protein product [Prorocentrum cordatum]|uniref:Uncharacterized protein n=1 Tax=Prorocentrum cordatum TaxID=2364126 RepID=A0ABN9QI00_9DINO|nr:unnamed protein product [Polarella glacialis]
MADVSALADAAAAHRLAGPQYDHRDAEPVPVQEQAAAADDAPAHGDAARAAGAAPTWCPIISFSPSSSWPPSALSWTAPASVVILLKELGAGIPHVEVLGARRDPGRPACASPWADVDNVKVESVEASAQPSSFVPRARLRSAAAAAVRAARLRRAEGDGVKTDRICYGPECGGAGTWTADSRGALAAASPAEPRARAPVADAAPQPEGEPRVPEAAEAERQVAVEAQAAAVVVSFDATCQATACWALWPRRCAAVARQQAEAKGDRQAAAELQAAERQAAERQAESERLAEAAPDVQAQATPAAETALVLPSAVLRPEALAPPTAIPQLPREQPGPSAMKRVQRSAPVDMGLQDAGGPLVIAGRLAAAGVHLPMWGAGPRPSQLLAARGTGARCRRWGRIDARQDPGNASRAAPARGRRDAPSCSKAMPPRRAPSCSRARRLNRSRHWSAVVEGSHTEGCARRERGRRPRRSITS